MTAPCLWSKISVVCARVVFPLGLAIATGCTVPTSAMAADDVYVFDHFAGSDGDPGQSGNVDALGRDARFYGPNGIAVDLDGVVWVTEGGNRGLRRITAGGDVHSYASGADPKAVAIMSRDSMVMIDANALCWTPGWVIAGSDDVFDGTGSIDGFGRGARFNNPTGLAIADENTIYVADSGNGTIRKVTLAAGGGEVTTLAGRAGQFGAADGVGSAARFQRPSAVAVALTGDLLVGDGPTIRKVSISGAVTTFAGSMGDAAIVDGPRTAARFVNVSGLAIDLAGVIYVTESVGVIRRIGTDGTVSTLAGKAYERGARDGPGSEARFALPVAIAVDRTGTLFVADSGNNAIRRGRLPTAPPPRLAPEPMTQSHEVNRYLAVFRAPLAGSPTYQWERNGQIIPGATGAEYLLGPVAPENAGLYAVDVTENGRSTTSRHAMLGITTWSKVVGAGEEVGRDIFLPASGNTYDQVLLKGPAAAVMADAGEVTRMSFLDLDGDIVQVEYSGPGTLSVVLETPSGPEFPAKYNQEIRYMRGHAGIVITGATENSHVSVFSVGRLTAVNQALFRDIESYDGVADLAFIAIASNRSRFGGVRAANASFFATQGLTGLYAPGIVFEGPVYLGDVTGFEKATAVLQALRTTDVRITGGDLLQNNGKPMQVNGVTRLQFTAGVDSHGRAQPAQSNRAVLMEDGIDVTARIVVNP